jgi:SAM-dependent methyltransferase
VIVASDVDPELLATLREHAARFDNLRVKRLDITRDLRGLGAFDMVVMFFVIHRLERWRPVLSPLVRLVGKGGSLYVSEFVGPSGIIYLANELGGRGRDPVSRMIRRYFELVDEPFHPKLKSTSIGPVLRALRHRLTFAGYRDFAWPQRFSVGGVHHKIEREVFAPFFSTHPTPSVLEQLKREFRSEWNRRVELVETIRVYRFTRA